MSLEIRDGIINVWYKKLHTKKEEFRIKSICVNDNSVEKIKNRRIMVNKLKIKEIYEQ